MEEKYIGKEKCKILKEIRCKIAEENGIEYNPIECTHEGDCAGTCPKCDEDLALIEQQIVERMMSGEKTSVKYTQKGIIGKLKSSWRNYWENFRRELAEGSMLMGDVDVD